jgi:transmembrane sensor
MKQQLEDRERAWKALESLDDHPRIRAWLVEAAARANVVTLDVARVVTPARHPDSASPHILRAAAAIAIVAVGALVGTGAYLHFSSPRYETRVGEQRDVLLPDGSRVTLNTNTALTVRYAKAKRYIELERGEALFAVKRDPQRPFEVAAGGTLTRALGTEFNVDLRESSVTVSVLEGAVRVAATGTDARPEPRADEGGTAAALPAASLAKGQALEFQPRARRLLEEKADVRRIDAWRTRRLEFSDVPLAEAVEEVNRYSTRTVVIGTRELAEVRVSGIFRISDLDGFLYSLREALGVQAHEAGSEVVLVRPAEPTVSMQ